MSKCDACTAVYRVLYHGTAVHSRVTDTDRPICSLPKRRRAAVSPCTVPAEANATAVQQRRRLILGEGLAVIPSRWRSNLTSRGTNIQTAVYLNIQHRAHELSLSATTPRSMQCGDGMHTRNEVRSFDCACRRFTPIGLCVAALAPRGMGTVKERGGTSVGFTVYHQW